MMQLVHAGVGGTTFTKYDGEPLTRASWPSKLSALSCAFHHRDDGGEGSRRPTRWWCAFPRAPWPSRRSALPPQRQVSPWAQAAAKGLAALPDSVETPPRGMTAAKGLSALPDMVRHSTGTTVRQGTRALHPATSFNFVYDTYLEQSHYQMQLKDINSKIGPIP